MLHNSTSPPPRTRRSCLLVIEATEIRTAPPKQHKVLYRFAAHQIAHSSSSCAHRSFMFTAQTHSLIRKTGRLPPSSSLSLLTVQPPSQRRHYYSTCNALRRLSLRMSYYHHALGCVTMRSSAGCARRKCAKVLRRKTPRAEITKSALSHATPRDGRRDRLYAKCRRGGGVILLTWAAVGNVQQTRRGASQFLVHFRLY